MVYTVNIYGCIQTWLLSGFAFVLLNHGQRMTLSDVVL